MSSLYDNLTKLSRRAGFLNLSEMCDAANVSRQTMTELKKGRTRKLSAKTAEKLCAVLGVTFDELYGIEKPVTDNDDGQNPANERRELAIDLFASLNPEDQELALDFLKRIAQSR